MQYIAYGFDILNLPPIISLNIGASIQYMTTKLATNESKYSWSEWVILASVSRISFTSNAIRTMPAKNTGLI
jgi:hypothetical protein